MPFTTANFMPPAKRNDVVNQDAANNASPNGPAADASEDVSAGEHVMPSTLSGARLTFAPKVADATSKDVVVQHPASHIKP